MTGNAKPCLLIFYDYFFPAYKAGGPIQSLTNVILALKDEYTVWVVTSDHDLNEEKKLPGIQTDSWSKILLPAADAAINVWYASTKPDLKKIVKQSNPSVVYLNGIFSYRFVILPLISIKNIKIVVCPRGMLQKGALAGKSFKKKIYLAVLKMSGFTKHVTWHATNEEEQSDIVSQFGNNATTVVAGNIPRKPVLHISKTDKQTGELRLVYLSLITEKKNLLQLINVVAKVKAGVSLDIYGPVKDELYWQKCIELINLSADRINYKGDVLPEHVQETFGRYDSLALLTKGENFGHALYESLSAGRPIITSYFTPWNELTDKKAGWNVDISNETIIIECINRLCDMDQQSFGQYCNGAYELATMYYMNGFSIANYKKLFS